MTSAEKPDPARKTHAFGSWAGLGALAALWPVESDPIRYPYRDEADALRGDFLRIGADLHGVIEREVAREQIKPD